MEKTEQFMTDYRYDGLARCLCAAYKAYTGGIGIDYMLKTYVQKQEILPTFWLDVAEMIVQAMTSQQNTEADKIVELRRRTEKYDLKPLTSMTDNDIKNLVEKLPEGCDVCGNPPPESVIWLLQQLRDLPQGLIQ